MGDFRILPHTQNFVRYMWSHRCADPYQLMVETFFPAVVKLALDLYTPQWDDFTMLTLQEFGRAQGRAAWARGGRHNRKKKGAIGPLAQARETIKGGHKSPLAAGVTKTILTIAAPFERIGMMMTVYSAVDNFYYNWQTMLVQRQFCQGFNGDGPFQRETLEADGLFTATGNPYALLGELQNRAGWSGGAFAVHLPVGRFYGWFTLEAKSIAADLPGCFLEVRVDPAGGIPKVFKSEEMSLNDREWITLTCTFSFDYPFSLDTQVGWYTRSLAAPVGPVHTRNAKIFIAGGSPGLN